MLGTVDTFDYVIVGAGSAGCVLAARLSEDPTVSVCLLEAGATDKSFLIRVPLGLAVLVPRPIHNWAFHTTPQPGLDGRRGYQPRGKTLGGSSSINAMVYTRGHRSDYDGWAALGNAGWSYADVLPYFRRAEHNERLADEFHGQGGPLNVADLRSPSGFSELWLAAAEPRDEAQCRLQRRRAGGHRLLPADAERRRALERRARLSHPQSRAPQSRRAHAGARDARRLRWPAGGGSRVSAGRRAADTFARGARRSSPPARCSRRNCCCCREWAMRETLPSFGIPVVAHSPGVGRNLRDHIDFVIAYESPRKDLIGFMPGDIVNAFRSAIRYRRDRRGIFTSNIAEAGGFLKTSPDLAAPDIQLHFCIGILESHGRRLHAPRGFSTHVCVLRPQSAGTLTLASGDPLAAPLIDPGFYTIPTTWRRWSKGFRIARGISQSPLLDPHRGKEMFTAGVASDDEIRAVLRRRSDTIYHPVGTCRMGVDDEAVVDPQLRVRGVSKRCASSMPRSCRRSSAATPTRRRS